MISCKQLVDLMLDFDDGSLSPPMHLDVEEHLMTCSSCVAYLQSYRLTVRLARQLPADPLPQSLEARLQEILAGRVPPQPPGPAAPM